nr:oxysterol-binding protein-related protein 1-like [Maniola hyperantus]
MSSRGENSNFEAEESLLYSARHGELTVVKALLDEKREGKLTLDINCKGKSKSNLGWTPLHLATYFGHREVVEALMYAGADVDEVNDSGDTALHKASFIGNEELVILLLNYKADVNIMNGEGKTAIDVCKTQDVQRLLEAAGLAERRDRERKLLTAAREGRVDEVQELLSSSNPPSINCVDGQGNTCLHCTAYRGHARVAVLFLQNGIDTTLRNNGGQLAIDLAKDNEMREVLNVRPVQRLQRTALRFEGPLMKRSRFLGWRPIWGVLQRGVFLYYGSRAEAAREGGRWRDRKYLDGAKLSAPDTEPALLVINYSDGDNHRLAVPQGDSVNACRQSWITALKEHIAFSGHYLWAGAPPDSAREATEDLEDECKPLGSMQDALTTATNSLALLDTQLRECAAIVAALDKSVNVGNSLHHSAYMVCNISIAPVSVGSMQDALTTATNSLALLDTQLRECAAIVAALDKSVNVGNSLHHSAYMVCNISIAPVSVGSMQDALTTATNSLALLDTQLRECAAIVAALDKSVNVGNSLHHSAYMVCNISIAPVSVGSMQDALTTATNSLALLDTQLRECAAIVAALDKSVNVGNSLHHSAYMVCNISIAPVSVGSMQDALTTATNSLALLDTQLRECAAIVAALDKSVNVGNSLHHSAYMRFQHACGSGQSALAALRHCAALVAQTRDRDKHALATQIERNRVLEEALAALARTHHALEMSVAEELTKSKRKKKNSQSNNDSKENFYDVYEDSDDDTLVTAGLNSPLGALSPWGSSPDLTRRTPIGSVDGDGERTPTNDDREEFDRRLSMASFSSGSPQSLHTALSPASSRGTLVSQGGHVYRNARPYKKTTKPR